MKKHIAMLGLVLLGASTLALAEDHELHHHQPRSYTEDGTRTYADGTVAKLHAVQTVSPGGISRQMTITNAEGKTASRNVTMSFDKSRHSWSRSVQGTTFSGGSYSSSAQGQGMGEEGFGGSRHERDFEEL